MVVVEITKTRTRTEVMGNTDPETERVNWTKVPRLIGERWTWALEEESNAKKSYKRLMDGPRTVTRSMDL